MTTFLRRAFVSISSSIAGHSARRQGPARRRRVRRLLVETFETRQLMAADVGLWADQLLAEGEGPNQSPVLTFGAQVALPTITEDENVPTIDGRGAFTVSQLLQGADYADADNSDAVFGSGIAITSLLGRGYLAYATDQNGPWLRVPAVTQDNAFLLATNFIGSSGATYPQWLCYVPDGSNGEDVVINFRAWDLTSGAPSNKTPNSPNPAPRFGDSTINGGSTAFSYGIGVGRLTISRVNDAPFVNNGQVVTLPAMNENTTAIPQISISTILSASFPQDVDINAFRGMAIVSAAGNGKWQYSTDGLIWSNIVSVSSTSSLLLSPSTRVRYRPDMRNGELASLGFKIWDLTSGSNSTNSIPYYADTSVNGGTTAFSMGTATAQLPITNVNDAPTITNGTVVRFVSTNENTFSLSKTVDSILTSASWSDVDIGASRGMAVLSLSGQGTWQYSTDGSTWASVGPVSSTSALLLSPTTRLRYAPDLKNGENPRLAFKAWDMTSGTASTNTVRSVMSAMPSGGTSAFSLANSQVLAPVYSLNDAPTMTEGNVPLPRTDEDTISSPFTVDSLLTARSWNDVDIGALKGIAVTAVTTKGNWQYSTDGSTWVNVGPVSISSALLLSSGTQLRFDPSGQEIISVHLTFKAWDQSSGVASTNALPSYGSATAGGLIYAYSSATATASMSVSWFNDAPTIGAGVSINMTPTNENTISAPILIPDILSASSYYDPDVNAIAGLAIIETTGAGVWQYSTNGTVWTNIGPVPTGFALVIERRTFFQESVQLRYVPNGMNGETATLRYRAWDGGGGSTNGAPVYQNATIVGGRTRFSENSGLISLVVDSVNDAPTIANVADIVVPVAGDVAVTTPVSVSSLLSSANANDVDSAAVVGMAIVGLGTAGWWQYSVDGVTWTLLPAVSSSAALLLGPTTQLRCWLNLLGGGEPTLSFKAWDQTSGEASTDQQVSLGDTTLSGGSSSYSLGTANVRVVLTRPL